MLKLTDEAETQLTKGYNHKAVKALDEVLGKLPLPLPLTPTPTPYPFP